MATYLTEQSLLPECDDLNRHLTKETVAAATLQSCLSLLLGCHNGV